jgi:hypothetical protein
VKKLLLAGLPVLIIIMGLPFLVTLMVVMSTTAAAECRTQDTQDSAPTELGDLGAIDGPVGGPVESHWVSFRLMSQDGNDGQVHERDA